MLAFTKRAISGYIFIFSQAQYSRQCKRSV